MQKIYKINKTYYDIDKIWSMTELNIEENFARGYINGIEIKWVLLYKHYKIEFQQLKIEEDETFKEYNKLLKKFKNKI